MKTVIVSSKNQVKVQAAGEGFKRMFPDETFVIQNVAVPSEVAVQPFSSAETLLGAFNRARNARSLSPNADFWIGIEGGVEEFTNELGLPQVPAADKPAAEKPPDRTPPALAAFAWVVVLGKNGMGQGQTGLFLLPPHVAELVRQGNELGEADDIIFGRKNSKQENGAVGILTGDVIDRAAFYEQAVILALIPFRNPELYY